MGFLRTLAADLERFQRHCDQARLRGAVRLNGTSDIGFEHMTAPGIGKLVQAFPRLQFYDYTKELARLRSRPRGYYLTLSMSEKNALLALQLLEEKICNVAVVFRLPKHQLPRTWLGFRVIDGDLDDLRFLDPTGVVVGLAAKGRAKYDATGFVVDPGYGDLGPRSPYPRVKRWTGGARMNPGQVVLAGWEGCE